MCERFTLDTEVDELVEQFRIDKVLSYRKREDMTPVNTVFAIVSKDRERLLDEFRWGLMPFWASDAICADGDSIGEKPVYDRMIRKQRCVIPCSGFFGKSKEAESKAKVREEPCFTKEEGKAFGLAGLYEVWVSPSGEEFRACTMLTYPDRRDSSGNRMPVVLRESDVEKWLDPSFNDKDRVQSLMTPVNLDQFVPQMRKVPVH
ncbi:SOS response-associated peptidase [Paenibacillus contaminans]|jgi:putative SOS response-associated peptidase YedK|uniref:Abasic site processing protein n=1 Tax=Paenibacillus contaminans TaxID=450362 RepID=A0A329MD36_9BACL|nr:SOS response-associated peptidase [Paenibacillus contaminans]RAV17891.1 SOS response-associated peptidase [Paenibacillus contaminans]